MRPRRSRGDRGIQSAGMHAGDVLVAIRIIPYLLAAGKP